MARVGRPAGAGTSVAAATPAPCPGDNDGLTLPAGFCAAVFADAEGGARHMAVAPNGDVFVALQTRPSGSSERGATTGGILALRDTNRDGRADRSEYFGDLGGTGIALRGGYLYADAKTAIVRYPLPADSSVRRAGRTPW
jgi:glucose/arabinose dehydrogenase